MASMSRLMCELLGKVMLDAAHCLEACIPLDVYIQFFCRLERILRGFRKASNVKAFTKKKISSSGTVLQS